MIVQSYPSIRKPVTPVVPVFTGKQQQQQWPSAGTPSRFPLTPKEVLRATKLKITNEEYRRRDDIVRETYKNCLHFVGDVVYPQSKEGMTKYGKCRITALVSSYYDYGDDWPKNDNPLIVHFTSEENGQEAFSTVNYFKEPESKC
jgi:hypothetical protein